MRPRPHGLDSILNWLWLTSDLVLSPGPLAARLERDFGIVFHHVDGLIEAAPDPSFADVFDPPFYDWVRWSEKSLESDGTDASLETVHAVIEHLDDIVADQGPFDGILGFSQGASVACAYLSHLDRRDGAFAPFRFALFFSSGGLSDDHLSLLQHLSGTEPAPEGALSIPSLHVHGTADVLHADALAMTRLWQPGSVTVVTHPGGHIVPKDAASISKIAAAVRLLMRTVVC